MGTNQENISTLTNEELAEKLKSLGENIGPITATTRSLYEKRLKKRLTLKSAAMCTISYSMPQTTSSGSNSSQIQPETATKDKTAENDESNYKGPFYGIQYPQIAPSKGCCVLTDYKDVVRLLKEHPGSRFNRFQSRLEAEHFSKMTHEPNIIKPCKTPPKAELSKPVPSEGSAFKGPRPQDLVNLRKAIEIGDLKTVHSLVWSNPRYLIGSGDNPTILQESARYNAIHVCALKNQAECAKMILDTIENPDFIKLMYPDDSEQSRWNRIQYLSDLYINMPDKGNCESPLHFACKFGNSEVAGILTKHPIINTKVTNKYLETPRDVVCSRLPSAPKAVKEKLYELLESQYYVPLLRSEDNTCPAKIGEPWCPNSLVAEHDQSGHELVPIPALNKTRIMTNRSITSPREAPMSVKAYAGPMSSEKAKQFQKLNSPGGLACANHFEYSRIKRSDINKGVERTLRPLAKEMKVPWSEYWDFLNTYINLDSEEGLQKLENHLQKKKEILLLEISHKREEEAEVSRCAEICDLLGRLNLSDSGKSPSSVIHFSRDTSNYQAEELVNGVTFCEPDPSATEGTEDDHEDDSDSICSFYTAVDDLDLEYSECSAEFNESWLALPILQVKVFMMGEEPSPTDMDVFWAIENTVICPNKYPLLYQWKADVFSYPEYERNRWAKLGGSSSSRRTLSQQPQMHSTPNSCVMPVKQHLSFDDEDGCLERSMDSDNSNSPNTFVNEKNFIRRNLFSDGSFS